MLAIRSDQPWVVRCPAKLNLLLEIKGRRGDGYHEIETVMVPIDLCDTLAFRPTVDEGIELSCAWATGLGGEANGLESLPEPQDNLVVRAIELLRKRASCPRGARVWLSKRIPSAAGLGGGSSDAAAALTIANRAWNLGWSAARLAELSAELGSDIPFFFARGAAVCRGRGERVEPIRTGGPLYFVLVKPPEGLPTASVFSELRAVSMSSNSISMIRALACGDATRVGGLLGNHLQPAAEALSPAIGRLADEFRRLDVLGCQMTGSGSCYFGICRNRRHARRLAATLRQRRVGEVFSATSDCCFPSQGVRL